MGYRRFNDRKGQPWEVRDLSHSEWELLPAGGNSGQRRTVRAPGYEKDPFELSEEELQRLLDEPGLEGRGRPAKSPFKD